MQDLRQSTAATVLVGPVLDSAGTAYTGAVIGDFNLTKNGTTAAMASAATATHSHNGHYLIALTTGNADTLGRLTITANNTTYAMPPARFMVLPAATYDGLVTSGAMPIDLTLAVPTSNTAQTVGDALNAARAQGFGPWTLVGTTLTLYAANGTTAVRTFELDSASAPTSRA